MYVCTGVVDKRDTDSDGMRIKVSKNGMKADYILENMFGCERMSLLNDHDENLRSP